jgi:hypothetical protein
MPRLRTAFRRICTAATQTRAVNNGAEWLRPPFFRFGAATYLLDASAFTACELLFGRGRPTYVAFDMTGDVRGFRPHAFPINNDALW